LAARIFGEQIACYGILPRACDVNVLFIGVKKSRFFKSTLQRKVFAGFGALRYQFHRLIGRQCQYPEHQVRHHFGRTSHPHVPPSKLILQSPLTRSTMVRSLYLSCPAQVSSRFRLPIGIALA
jgi:hypothetical protein